ncbi:hypothetical protein [Serratia fonticola]|uniref:hypothetical protein n=1 Tax=Serratia fonticola TaxID=47917 RepID=UPI001378AACE|nr:hypothetical protein [Serratia fonticola]NCG50243.1 hypothetical protein [Serratia fonticola]
MFDPKNFSIEAELRYSETLLSATAELLGGNADDNETAYELLDRVLVRIREIRSVYLQGGFGYVE